MVAPNQLTMSWSDLGAIFGIVGTVAIAAAVYTRLLIASELGKSENRIMEKIKLAFAQKELTDLKFINVERDVSDLKRTHEKE